MKKIVNIFFLVSNTIIGFQTLFDVQKQAQNLHEYPFNNSQNPLYPNYTATYKKIAPNFINRLFYKKQLIPSQLFHVLQNKSLTQEPPAPTIKLLCKPHSKVIIWGNLHGAFHSLTRSFEWLAQENIIDNQLIVIKPDYYFVFNGNAINFGPYNLETLLLIISFMRKNPNKVFYIQGEQESNYRWINGTLKNELQQRAHYVSKQSIPLQEALQSFFNTLPQTLLITTPEDSHHFIRISSGNQDNSTAPKNITIQATQSDPIQSSSIIAMVKNLDWYDDNIHIENGISLLGQDQAATVWTILSSPIETHQKLLNFNRDAFGIITIKNPLNKSIITLYNRSTKHQEPFTAKQSFNIQTAAPSTYQTRRSIQQKIATLGSSMALLQGVPTMGERTQRGMIIRINQENKKQNNTDYFFKSVVLNDNYTPHIARQNILTLLNQGTNMIVLPVGSPTLDAYLDLIKDNKVAVFFPITGGPQFRDPSLKEIIHFRGTYTDEVRALVEYMITERAARKFAFFYQDDAYGLGPLKAAEQELKKMNITEWTAVPYQRNSINYAQQAQRIKEAQPDTIGLFSTAEATRELIRELGVDFLLNKQLFGISFLAEESFRRYIQNLGLNIIFGAVVPNPATSNLPIVQEYRQEMDQYGYPYDVFSLEAYIATSILLDAMKHVKPPITKEKILHKLESYNNYHFKGLNLTFNPERRDLANQIWIETGQNIDWVQKNIDLKKELHDQGAHRS